MRTLSLFQHRRQWNNTLRAALASANDGDTINFALSLVSLLAF